MNGRDVFGWVKLLAPIILARIPQTAPIAGDIVDGLNEAEAIHDATGPGKLAHVLKIGQDAGHAVNAERPNTVDVRALTTTLTSAIETTFAVAKLMAASHGAPHDDSTTTATPAPGGGH